MYKLVMKFLILSVISLQSSKSYEDEGVWKGEITGK